MVEALARRPPLLPRRDCAGANLAALSGVAIRCRHPLTIVEIASWRTSPEPAAVLSDAAGFEAPRPCKANSGWGLTLLWSGPQRWHAVVEGTDAASRLAALMLACGRDFITVDQSHAKVCFRLSGVNARDVLAAGSSVDFRPSRFVPGDCAATALGKIGVLIHVVEDADTVDIYVQRSMARSAAEWLLRASAEFGGLMAD